MAGRRRKSETAKSLSDDQHRKAPVVHVPAEAPPMPEYFKKSDTLPDVWIWLINGFSRINILAQTDATIIENLCVLVDQFRRMTVYLIENGETYSSVTKTGTRVYKRPEYEIRKDTMGRLQAMLTELGATPASRGKVTHLLQADLFGGKASTKNAWADFN